MFIKIKGEHGYSKSPNQLTTMFVNIHNIVYFKHFPNQGKEDYKTAIYLTDDSTLYTDDDVAALIEKRMVIPFSEPFLEKEKEKEYREPILPQDINCLAEFSDNEIDWEEGQLTGYSQYDTRINWSGKIHLGIRHAKYARIPV